MSAPAGLPARLSGRVADELANRVLRRAVEAGLLPDRPLPDWERFRGFRTLVRDTFVVPDSSITPLMARVLYGVAHLARPQRILGVGTYCGNALVWLTGPGFGPHAVYLGSRAVGVDIDPAATRAARANFVRIGADARVTLRCLDGHEAGDDSFDLLLLDADDPVRRKSVYLSLLAALYPWLEPGGLVLAHDICVPSFVSPLADYRRAVHETHRFCASLALEIDACGLEVSRKVLRSAADPRPALSAPGTPSPPGGVQ
jgi:predicted O-methyltransferase YrrM